MADPLEYLYPLDITGEAASNKVVNERHTLNPPEEPLDFHFILPKAGPYYRTTMVVRHIPTNRILVRGSDWVPGHKFHSASYELQGIKGGVYLSILLMDRTLSGEIELSEYQTLGGEWTLSETKLLEILSNRAVDPRFVTYDEVSGKPSAFPPIEHNHPVDDLTGMAEQIAATYDVAAAVREQTESYLTNPPIIVGDWYNKDEVNALIQSQELVMDQKIDEAKAELIAMETGAVTAFAMPSPPVGWLKCNGAAVSRTTYANLYAKIGTRFGVGNGSTTFNLPELRGEFIRGWDDARGIDTGRVLGSTQAESFLSHTHTAASSSNGAHSHAVTVDTGGSHTHTATTATSGDHSHIGTASSAGEHTHTGTADAAGAHTHIVNGSVDSSGGSASFDGNNVGTEFNRNTSSAGEHTHTVSISTAAAHTHTVSVTDAGSHTHTVTVSTAPSHTHTATADAVAAHSHTITVANTGGSETRPRNIALLYCIRY